MSDVHARPPVPPVEGRCTWRHHYEDVDLACDDVVVFGEVYCTDHLDPTRVAGDDGKHKCPYAPCERRVPMHLFACRAHWMKVPPDLRAALYAAYRSASPAEYLAVRADCVEAMNAR
jgi:hypothetical protein